MDLNHLLFLIKMNNSSANKNQDSFLFFAFVQVIIIPLFERFFTLVQGVRNLFSSFWSLILSQLESFNPGTWDEKNPDFDSFSWNSCFQEKQDDGSLCRDDVELVMKKFSLFCSPEGEQLPQQLGSKELSGLFEEKEPSLEEVKEAFDVFDENKDGFIDAKELQRVLIILGLKEGFEVENCRKMIKTFDDNGDGMIDFREFVKFMENSFVEL